MKYDYTHFVPLLANGALSIDERLFLSKTSSLSTDLCTTRIAYNKQLLGTYAETNTADSSTQHTAWHAHHKVYFNFVSCK